MSEYCAGALISGHDSVRRELRKKEQEKGIASLFIVQFYVP